MLSVQHRFLQEFQNHLWGIHEKILHKEHRCSTSNNNVPVDYYGLDRTLINIFQNTSAHFITAHHKRNFRAHKEDNIWSQCFKLLVRTRCPVLLSLTAQRYAQFVFFHYIVFCFASNLPAESLCGLRYRYQPDYCSFSVLFFQFTSNKPTLSQRLIGKGLSCSIFSPLY